MPLHFDLRSRIGSLDTADRLNLGAEDILHLLTRFEPLGIWRIDARTGECRLSRQCLEIYGFSGNEVGLDLAACRDRIHHADLPVFSEAISTAVERRSSFMINYRVSSGQGVYRFVRSIGMYRPREDGGADVVGVTQLVGEQIRQLVMTS